MIQGNPLFKWGVCLQEALFVSQRWVPFPTALELLHGSPGVGYFEGAPWVCSGKPRGKPPVFRRFPMLTQVGWYVPPLIGFGFEFEIPGSCGRQLFFSGLEWNLKFLALVEGNFFSGFGFEIEISGSCGR